VRFGVARCKENKRVQRTKAVLTDGDVRAVAGIEIQ
jgi:hypothetical protein